MMSQVALPVHGPAPDRQVEVLGHSIWYDATAWKRELPGADEWWPPAIKTPLVLVSR
jgi:hypothetical protein